jgi:hypothetical protein
MGTSWSSGTATSGKLGVESYDAKQGVTRCNLTGSISVAPLRVPQSRALQRCTAAPVSKAVIRRPLQRVLCCASLIAC